MVQNLKIKKIVNGNSFLITGGTGSFGKTITSELLKFNPSTVIIYSRSEEKQEQMKYQFKKWENLKFVLGDVRDKDQLTRTMNGIDFVFHAAAQKQVPRTELNVLEGVKTNVLGAQNVIDAAMISGVKKAIAISTDKAVEPINVMGMTKALQERLFLGANKYRSNSTIFSCVRYGNVLGSTGSVLPLFIHQLISGENLTITHKDMTRFVITLEQAVELVLTSLIESKGGELFVPIIPSHKITDLAQSLIEMFPQKKAQIKITGIRLGEKLHETLIAPNESSLAIPKKGYYVIKPAVENKKTQTKKPYFRFSSDNAEMINVNQLKNLLKNNDLVKSIIL